MDNEGRDIKLVSGVSMRSDTKDGNQAQRDRLKESAIKRMDRAESWILVCFDAKTEEGRPSSWVGLCSTAGTKLGTLKFFMEMLMDGARMVGLVMAEALRDAQEERRKGRGS